MSVSQTNLIVTADPFFFGIQCNKEIQQLHLSLRKLKIGTYVSAPPLSEVPEGQNPYYPIATASLNTRVFDVVHMFSERSISAVPIINEEGVVVNLYETVDVIVRGHFCFYVTKHPPEALLITIDPCSIRSLPVTRSQNFGSS
jgi:hypothetical protein